MIDDFDMGSSCGMSIRIVSMGGRSSSGFPYDCCEGVESRENYQAMMERERFLSNYAEGYEGRDEIKIDGRELSEGRGYIKTPSSPYFPNFY
jgi:hypothetical protein